MSGRCDTGRCDCYEVTCHICGWRYHEQDPEVTYHYDMHVWACTYEPDCLQRAATTEPERTVTP